MDHLEPFRRRVREAREVPPPPPWRPIVAVSVGGLTEVGFADNSELLLVLSWQGRGVFDCSDGRRLARDTSADRTDWYGHDNLIANGFGPLEGQYIRLCGLWGGGLPLFTKDGWRVERVTLTWPSESILLFEPRQKQIYTAESRFHKLGDPVTEVRAFGFSYSGKTLMIATSSDITVFGRE